MKLSRYLWVSYCFIAFFMSAQASEVALGQLLKALPELANLKPSPIVRPGIVGKIITIDGKKYNIRYCYYESSDPHFNDNFGTFVQNKKYLNNMSKSYSGAELSVGPVMTFGSSKEDKENKIFYMMSMKEITEIGQ